MPRQIDSQLLKCISTRTVFGDKPTLQRLVLSDEKRNHPLYRIYGRAEGYVTGKSKFQNTDGTDSSDWVKLAGEFEAVNMETGQIFNSAMCFLPNYLVGPILNNLKQDGVDGVFIAYDIYAQYDASSGTSYIFLAEPIRRADEKSALDEMRAALPPPATKQKALADTTKKK